MFRRKYVTGGPVAVGIECAPPERRMPPLVDVAWLILGCQKETGR
jgi:hypothetical protein